MEKIHTLIIALVAGGIVSMAVSFGVGVASLLGEYWIDYSTTTTTTATISGFPATIVAAIRANIGLFTTCYFVDTTTTVTSLFGTTTTSLSTNACVDSATTGYIEGDTIKMIQQVGQAAGGFLGLGFLSGIIVLVLNILKKLAKPICFVAVVPSGLSFISTIMLVAALIILNKELLTGMSLGETANLGIVSLVFAFIATVAYAVAAAFIIKRALSTASRTAPEKEQANSESKDEKKETETENAATP